MPADGGDARPDVRTRPYVVRPPGPRVPPSLTFRFQVRARNRSVAADWERLAGRFPNALRACFDWMATYGDTRESDDCYELGGELVGTWQYKVPDGGRVWFQRMPGTDEAVITRVTGAHPKQTLRPGRS